MNYNTLKEINGTINEAVTYTSDPSKYNRPDFWEDALDDNKGDCEDYAIAKLRKLLAEGWPMKDLKLGLCFVESGEYHCVLIATCDSKDWVLDNRHPFPTYWEDLPYRWDKFYLFGEKVWRVAG